MLAWDVFDGGDAATTDVDVMGGRGLEGLDGAAAFDLLLHHAASCHARDTRRCMQRVEGVVMQYRAVHAAGDGAIEGDAPAFGALLQRLCREVAAIRAADGDARADAVVRAIPPLLLPFAGGAPAICTEALLVATISATTSPAQLGATLAALGLAEQPLLAAACRRVFHDVLTEALEGCSDVLDEDSLDGVLERSRATSDILAAIDPTHSRTWVDATAYLEFGRMRIDMIFNMLVEYPSSEPAILDLKRCLIEVPSLYTYLVAASSEQIGRRLLHVGAKTEDIIQVYIDTMRVVDMLFPGQHRAVDAITGQIQRYVRNRKDGAALFVLGLIGDPSSQLAELLHPELKAKRGELCDVEEEGMSDCQKHTRRLDVLKRLVQTFGSQDNVLLLYRSVLAEKLIAIDDFDADSEITALELLKVRFGEAPLHNCEVMVKDIADSKRFTTAAQTSNPDLKPHTTLIQSHLYWPQIPTSSGFIPHKVIKDIQEAYAKEYARQKEPRRLAWQDGVGSVRLTISMYTNRERTEKKMIPVQAGIMQATLLLHLVDAQTSEAGGLAASQLAELTGLDAGVVNAKMLYWTQNGMVVFHPSSGVYKCAEAKSATGAMTSEDDDIGATEIMAAEEEETNERIGDFVGGILTNFGPQDVSFIDNKLRQFMPDYSRTAAQLEALLNNLVAAGELSVQGKTYHAK